MGTKETKSNNQPKRKHREFQEDYTKLIIHHPMAATLLDNLQMKDICMAFCQQKVPDRIPELDYKSLDNLRRYAFVGESKLHPLQRRNVTTNINVYIFSLP